MGQLTILEELFKNQSCHPGAGLSLEKERPALKGCRNSLSPQGRAAAAKSLQLCPTLCDPIDSSPPGAPVPGILQARTLEWVAISFSNA